MNLFIPSIVLVTTCLSCSPSYFGPPSVPGDRAVGDWPDSGAAVLDDRATLRYRVLRVEGQAERLIAELAHRRRIKILSEKGLEAATVELEVDAYSSVTNIHARSVSSTGAVHTLDSSAVWVEHARAEPARVSEGLRTMGFTVPAATVGGVIEYRYDRVFLDADFVEPWALGGALPRVRSQLDVITPPGIRVEYRTGEGERLTDEPPLRRAVQGGGERLVFVRTHIAPAFQEPRSVHALRSIPWVATVAVEVGFEDGKRRLETWDAVRTKIERMVSSLRNRVSSTGTPERIFAEVRERLSVIDRLGVSVVQPEAPDRFDADSPVSSRDAAEILRLSLEGSELPAYYALVASDAAPPLLRGFPSFFPFARAVVAVDVSQRVANDASCRQDPVSQGLLCTTPVDSYAFLDPSCRTCRFGEVPIDLTDGRALVFKGEHSEWVDVPADPPQRNRIFTQWLFSMDRKGQLEGAMNGEFTGHPARVLRRALRRSRVDDVVPLRRLLFADDVQVALSEQDIQSLENVEEELVVAAAVRAEAKKSGFESFEIRVDRLIGSALPGTFRLLRRSPALLPGPRWTETAATFELPRDYSVELPEVAKLVSRFAEYALGYRFEGRDLVVQRRFILKVRRVDPSDWEDFRSFLSRVEKLESTALKLGRPS